MPYNYLRKGNQYGLQNKRTRKVIWYNPKKVKSMEKLKKMARLREAYSHGFKPTRGLASANKSTRRYVSSKGGKAKGRRW